MTGAKEPAVAPVHAPGQNLSSILCIGSVVMRALALLRAAFVSLSETCSCCLSAMHVEQVLMPSLR